MPIPIFQATFPGTTTMLSKILSMSKNFFGSCEKTMTIEVIKASNFVVFDLHTSGNLHIELSDGSTFACNLFRLYPDDRAELIKACLENHCVIGRDLAFAFGWCASLTEFWSPQVSLDVAALARLFLVDPADIVGLSALAALYRITGATNFDDARDEIRNLDTQFHNAFFGAVEKVAYDTRGIIKQALQDAMTLEPVDFAASLGCDDNMLILRGPDGKQAFSFDESHFEEIEEELERSLETATQKIWSLVNE